ncbi:histidine phosphatase family protein [Sneathiella marina]|uniref:Histidine phosphatase family protein n=1 Tax=Sneathiella marina TaxID=2950108 RepID=A0ABY4VZD6_9PROT|nr:phosphoglycerate mutase family protein [Sneathiella marina]USG60084.1 histidine phosphatase family protein [Sneathiella marina]
MKVIEIRRHAMRQKPKAHLSLEGIELAKFASARMGPYDRVITSRLPRSMETAVAMGFEGAEHLEELGDIPDDILEKLNWPNTLQAISEIIKTNKDCFQFARRQAKIWLNCIKDLPEESRILIISHGGIMELGVMGSICLDGSSVTIDAFGYCEGIRLEYESEKYVNFNPQLMPEERRLINSTQD